jgi:hypothetical protein
MASLRRRLMLTGTLAVCLLGVLTAAPDGQRVWFKFNKAFINAHYDNGEAFGQLQAQTWGAAQNPHSSKCGGNDAELHIGALKAGLGLPNTQAPLSGPVSAADASWGAVFELPDASAGGGPARLKTLTGKTVTFDGYFRVWNEGHWKGVVHPSNPHHVFEVHPAWGFTFQGGSFEDKSRIRTMTAYRGYGLSKYEAVLEEAADWLKAYQDNDFLYVQLQDSSNFFQLPIEVTDTDTTAGGTSVTLEVYSSNKYKRVVYTGLRGITINGANLGAALDVGDRLTVLGFFSVNLKTAIAAIPASANSVGLAWSVEDALEFFIFGKTSKPAWPKSQKCE